MHFRALRSEAGSAASAAHARGSVELTLAMAARLALERLRILTLEPSRHPELVSCSTCVVLLGRLGAQSCSHELRIGGREALEAQRVRDAESRKHRAEGLISRPQTCGGAEVPRGTYRSASGEDSAPLCLVED